HVVEEGLMVGDQDGRLVGGDVLEPGDLGSVHDAEQRTEDDELHQEPEHRRLPRLGPVSWPARYALDYRSSTWRQTRPHARLRTARMDVHHRPDPPRGRSQPVRAVHRGSAVPRALAAL